MPLGIPPGCCYAVFFSVQEGDQMYSRAERRHNDFRKAIRKKKICDRYAFGGWYDNLHQYSKNKIHCSCPMCCTKNKS